MTQLPDRFEHHSPKPEGTSAKVETSSEVRVTTPEKICGMGHRMKRKEEAAEAKAKADAEAAEPRASATVS